MSNDPRKASRIIVNAPAIIESIGQTAKPLHPNVAGVFSRVNADVDSVGKRFPAVIRDLSPTGAFVAGVTLPLLARVAMRFDVPAVGRVDAIGWVLWQRSDECRVPDSEGELVTVPKGFGVLFESIDLDVRNSIAKLVAQA